MTGINPVFEPWIVACWRCGAQHQENSDEVRPTGDGQWECRDESDCDDRRLQEGSHGI